MANPYRGKYNYYQGYYTLKNPQKYKGDPRDVVYRSSLEYEYFQKMDLQKHILEWSSEEIVIPYLHPISKNMRRYFVDLYIKYRATDGSIRSAIIEIKPAVFTRKPKLPKRVTNSYKKRCCDFLVNLAKWDAANKFAQKNGMNFFIWTEEDLN